MTEASFMSVLAERARQDKKWGGPTYDDKQSVVSFRYAIRSQLDRASLEAQGSQDRDYFLAQRSRLVKVAAIAVAAIEAIDRKLTL